MKSFRKIKSWGFVLLAIYLILTGAFSLLKVSFTGAALLMDLLAIAAGVLILIQR